MRTQGEARFIAQDQWHVRSVSAAAMVRESISKERAEELGRGILCHPKNSGAAGMVREAIAKERKLNKVNLIVGAALFVGVVALLLGVANGY